MRNVIYLHKPLYSSRPKERLAKDVSRTCDRHPALSRTRVLLGTRRYTELAVSWLLKTKNSTQRAIPLQSEPCALLRKLLHALRQTEPVAVPFVEPATTGTASR